MAPVYALKGIVQSVLGVKDQHVGISNEIHVSLCVRLGQVLEFSIRAIDNTGSLSIQSIAIATPGVRLRDRADLDAGYCGWDVFWELDKRQKRRSMSGIGI